MGKPYTSEIAKLEQTYAWCLRQDIASLTKAIKVASSLPLITVGSGGSFTAAEFMAGCHREAYKQLAIACTPMDAKGSFSGNNDASVWFFSAGGSNIDIRRCFKHFALIEPKQLAALVGKKNSPISEIMQNHQYLDFFDYELPSKKDGFLATNSLLAFCTLLTRAYSEVLGYKNYMPATLAKLIKTTVQNQNFEKELAKLWDKNTIQLIYSSSLKSGALDLESKFTESGLMAVLPADLRNFAHGRHHWFAKREKESGILAFSTKEDRVLANKTLGLLPKSVPQAHLEFSADGLLSRLASVVVSIKITGLAGPAKGIDPGNPGVPKFGRQIYQLREKSGFVTKRDSQSAAILRKAECELSDASKKSWQLWGEAYKVFSKKLEKENFGALVFDYDGTIVDTRHRFDPPTKEIVAELHRFLEHGLTIGIATGRGKSVRIDLQKTINKKYWKQVLIGYYNGSDIAYLSDNQAPDGTTKPVGDLAELATILKDGADLFEFKDVESRKKQISMSMRSSFPECRLWETAQNLLVNKKMRLSALRSSHSIDIVDTDVTKNSVVDKIQALIGQDTSILTIGDRGKWPGNDYFLLSQPYSLSVDEVSPLPDSGWNLAPAGVRGLQATLFYLEKLKCYKGKSPYVRFK